MLLTWKLLPYFATIAAGILLPEWYLRQRWSLHVLMVVRLVTLFAAAGLGTLFALWAAPSDGDWTVFTRAFLYIVGCRIIMLSSHEYAAKKEGTRDTHADPL
jgi:hypothetical protein